MYCENETKTTLLRSSVYCLFNFFQNCFDIFVNVSEVLNDICLHFSGKHSCWWPHFLCKCALCMLRIMIECVLVLCHWRINQWSAALFACMIVLKSILKKASRDVAWKIQFFSAGFSVCTCKFSRKIAHFKSNFSWIQMSFFPPTMMRRQVRSHN